MWILERSAGRNLLSGTQASGIERNHKPGNRGFMDAGLFYSGSR